ncbi:esterase [Leeia oryzae]|uniref:esterase n=1 Tax=Leeia oryzae TaxID=356662 RepID=UPI00037179AD|nr:esterase [Leeia oryzae]
MSKPALFIFLHGVGDNAAGMQGLANVFRHQFPDAHYYVPNGTMPFGMGTGRQWFSIEGVTEENRTARVAEKVPALIADIKRVQAEKGVAPENIVLVGFSQGSIMSLAAVAVEDGLVGHVLAFSGRYASLPAEAPKQTRLHFFHGEADPVMPVQLAYAAVEHLGKLGGTATLDTTPGLGHNISQDLLSKAIAYLQE